MSTPDPDSTGFSPVPKLSDNSFFDLPPVQYSPQQLSAPRLQAQLPAYDNSNMEATNGATSVAPPDMVFGGSRSTIMPGFTPPPAPSNYQPTPSAPVYNPNQFGGTLPANNPYLKGMPGPAGGEPTCSMLEWEGFEERESKALQADVTDLVRLKKLVTPGSDY